MRRKKNVCLPRLFVGICGVAALFSLFLLYLVVSIPVEDNGDQIDTTGGGGDARHTTGQLDVPGASSEAEPAFFSQSIRPGMENSYPRTKRWEPKSPKPKYPSYYDKLGPYFQNAGDSPTTWWLDQRTYDCSLGECALSQFPECSWNGGPYRLKPHSRVSGYLRMIRFLNWSNVTYFLITGSALGALRHGGVIPGDGDIDVVFPVWLQAPDFHALCEDARDPKGPILRSPTPEKEDTLTLCDLTRNNWVTYTQNWITPLVKNHKLGIHKRKFGGFRLTGGIGVDFVTSIYDQALVNGTRNGRGGICRCEFSGIETLTLEDSWYHMERTYGQNWIYPRKEPAHFLGKN